jgi:hypothetical protein
MPFSVDYGATSVAHHHGIAMQKFWFRIFRVSGGCYGVLLIALHAQAQPDISRVWLNAGFYSAHFDTGKGLRNANPGVGFEYPLDGAWSITAGRFINSDNENSNYLGAYYQPWRAGGWKLGAVAGLFNGYPEAFNGGWFPAVLPVASWEGQHLGLNVAFVPPLKHRLYGAVSFQVKYRLQLKH